MARVQGQPVLRSTVLDRLSGAHGTTSAYGSIRLQDLKQALTRDLNKLLNTRVWWPGDFDHLEEAGRSILTYGIPDLTTYSWSAAGDRREICARIETAIKTFEPRLLQRTVKVSFAETEATDYFRARLRIEAMLHVEPYTEPVSFDTEIALDTGAVEVKGAQ